MIIKNDNQDSNSAYIAQNNNKHCNHNNQYLSSMSWSAVFAGAGATIGFSLILTSLSIGMGFGLMSSSLSQAVLDFTIITGACLSISQWIPAAIGGYIAGRLGANNMNNCNYNFKIGNFKPIVYGFLAWMLATFFVAFILTSALTSLVSGVTKNASIIMSQAVSATADHYVNDDSSPNLLNRHVIATLLRSGKPNITSSKAEVTSEIIDIILKGVKEGDINKVDRKYLSKVVSIESEISLRDATKKVNEVIDKMQVASEKIKKSADSARKSTQTIFLFMFFAMAIGALLSCGFAIIGSKCNAYKN